MKKSEKLSIWAGKVLKTLVAGILGILVFISTVGTINLRPYDADKPRSLVHILKGLGIVLVAALAFAAMIWGTVTYFLYSEPLALIIGAVIAILWPITIMVFKLTPENVSDGELREWRKKKSESKHDEWEECNSQEGKIDRNWSPFLSRYLVSALLVALVCLFSVLYDDKFHFNIWAFIAENWIWFVGGAALIALSILVVKNRTIGLGFSRLIYFFLSLGFNKIDDHAYARWEDFRQPIFKGIMFTLFLDLLAASGVYSVVLYFQTGFWYAVFIIAAAATVWTVLRIKNKGKRNYTTVEKLFDGFMKYKFSEDWNIPTIIANLTIAAFILFALFYVLPQETLGFGNIGFFIKSHRLFIIGALVVLILVLILIIFRSTFKRLLARPKTLKEFQKIFPGNLHFYKHQKAILSKLLRSSSLTLLGEFLDEEWYVSSTTDKVPFAPVAYRYIGLLEQDHRKKGQFTKPNRHGKYNPLVPRAFSYLADILIHKGELMEDCLLTLLNIFENSKNSDYLDLLRPFDKVDFNKDFMKDKVMHTDHLSREKELQRIAEKRAEQEREEKKEWMARLADGDITAFLKFDPSTLNQPEILKTIKSFFNKYAVVNIPVDIFHYSVVKKQAIWGNSLDSLFEIMKNIFAKSFDDELLSLVLEAYKETLNFLNTYVEVEKAHNSKALEKLIANKSAMLMELCPQ